MGTELVKYEAPTPDILNGGFPLKNDLRYRAVAAEAGRVLAKTRLNEVEAGLIQAKARADEAEYTAEHDGLTNLYNRAGIIRELDGRIVEEENGQAFAVFFIDLDRFKDINDNLGHDVGDEVLITVASQLTSLGEKLTSMFRREGDKVAHHKRGNELRTGQSTASPVGRMGGDEFIVIADLGDLDPDGDMRSDTIKERFETTQQYLRSGLNEYRELHPENIKNLGYGHSVGGTYWEPHQLDRSVDEERKAILSEADAEMYKIKRASGHSR